MPCPLRAPAGLETRETADLEVCATPGRSCTAPGSDCAPTRAAVTACSTKPWYWLHGEQMCRSRKACRRKTGPVVLRRKARSSQRSAYFPITWIMILSAGNASRAMRLLPLAVSATSKRPVCLVWTNPGACAVRHASSGSQGAIGLAHETTHEGQLAIVRAKEQLLQVRQRSAWRRVDEGDLQGAVSQRGITAGQNIRGIMPEQQFARGHVQSRGQGIAFAGIRAGIVADRSGFTLTVSTPYVDCRRTR